MHFDFKYLFGVKIYLKILRIKISCPWVSYIVCYNVEGSLNTSTPKKIDSYVESESRRQTRYEKKMKDF